VTVNITVYGSPPSPHWVAAPIPQIAKMLGVSKRAVRYLIRCGELPTFRAGGTLLVRRTDALSFLDRRFMAVPRPRPQLALTAAAEASS
jgi:excisionase family DNA binding protein